MLIRADHITFTHKKRLILDDVSVSIAPGEFLTVIGPNGAGKTTLLRILMRFLKPQKGNVEWMPDLRIGYVPQRFHVSSLMPLTVTGFLKLSRAYVKQKAEELLEELSLSEHRHTMLYALSGGELQRVLLVRALLCDPHLLVLDEPAQQLDVQGQLRLYDQIRQAYKQRNCGVLMISHDLHFVMSNTDHVLCLFHHTCCSGKPESVAADPDFISTFGKDMARMMAVYQHDHDHSHDHCDHH